MGFGGSKWRKGCLMSMFLTSYVKFSRRIFKWYWWITFVHSLGTVLSFRKFIQYFFFYVYFKTDNPPPKSKVALTGMSRHTSKLFTGYSSLYANRVNVRFLPQTFRDATRPVVPETPPWGCQRWCRMCGVPRPICGGSWRPGSPCWARNWVNALW